MKQMTSRERVLAAAERRPADLTPVMFMIEPHTAVKLAVEVKPPRRPLMRFFWKGVRDLSKSIPNNELADLVQFGAILFMEDYFRELGADVMQCNWTPWPLWVRGVERINNKFFIRDMYGALRGMGGMYIETHETACPGADDLDRYEFPDLGSPVHFAHVRMTRLANPGVFLVGQCPGMQDWSQLFHPLEKLYSGMIEYPDLIKRFFRKLCEHSLQIIRGMSAAGADGIFIFDDYGTQQSMFISKAMWTEFTFPMLKRQCDEIHRLGLKAILHSCGTVGPLLDKFVEAGVDILHPFQPLPGNNLEDAIARFGTHLSFATGIDVQRIVSMTPDQVYADILATARIASRHNGFILCHTNGLQKDTPTENLRAMFRAIHDIKKKIY